MLRDIGDENERLEDYMDDEVDDGEDEEVVDSSAVGDAGDLFVGSGEMSAMNNRKSFVKDAPGMMFVDH